MNRHCGERESHAPHAWESDMMEWCLGGAATADERFARFGREATAAAEGDIAIVTQRSGRKFVGIYTLAPGIDYFWAPVIRGRARNFLRDPDVSADVIGRVTSPVVGDSSE